MTIYSEECTPRLRWVSKSIMGLERKLQQAWTITTLDEHSQPSRQRTEWRDVPYEAYPEGTGV